MNTAQLARHSAFLGGIIWLGVVVVRYIGRMALPTLALILLLGVLVVAPLALMLVGLPSRTGTHAPLYRLAILLQPPAALLALISLIVESNPTAVLLSLPWLLLTLLVSVQGLSRQVSFWPPVDESAINFGLIYLSVGGVWFLAARANVALLGFREPFVTLTAIHFHFITLGALIFTGMVGRSLPRGNTVWRLYRVAAIGMIISPSLVALGITFSVVIEMLATAILSLSLLVLAAITITRVVPRTGAWQSLFLITSSLAVTFAMIFATAYVLGELTGAWELSIVRMIQVHGWVNALGFVLPGLFAWSLETPRGRVPAAGVPFSRFAGRGFIGPRFFDEAIDQHSGRTPIGLVDNMDEYWRHDLPVEDLPAQLRAFYEGTANHRLLVIPEWKPGFRLLSRLYKRISRRVGQMNLPVIPESNHGHIHSKIVPLDDVRDGRSNVRAWIRTYEKSSEAVYVAAYAAHRYADHTYMNIAFPLPGGNLTSILRLFLVEDSTRSSGLGLTSLRHPEFVGDEGVYFTTCWLTVRLPINETITVWAANRDEAQKRFGYVAPDQTTVAARHDMWLFGKAFLTLYYFIYPDATAAPSLVT